MSRPTGPILALDAAGGGLSAGVFDERFAPLAERHEPEARGAAHRLLPMAEACLAEAGLRWDEIGLIAVSTGPGDFTGARIGVAAARGLSLSTGAAAAGASRFEHWLEAFAAGAEGAVAVALAARAGMIHVARFENGRLAEPAPATLSPDAAAAHLGGARVIGDAAGAEARPALAALARAAARNAAMGAGRPAPLYLRPPDAAPAAPPPPLIG